MAPVCCPRVSMLVGRKTRNAGGDGPTHGGLMNSDHGHANGHTNGTVEVGRKAMRSDTIKRGI